MAGNRVVVFGSVNVDVSLAVAELPKTGETVMATRLGRNFGGKGLNQAIAAARAGADTALLACVGADADGAAVRRLLAAEDISASGVRTVAQATGSAVVVVDERGDNTIVVAPLANSALTDLTQEDEALLASCAVLLCQLEVPVESVVAALRIAHDGNAMTVLNAAPAGALPDEIVGSVNVLVVNEGEARSLAATMDAGVDDYATRLLRIAPQVIVTRGADGADYLDRDGGARHVDAPRVQALDSTGAGDAFCGALCAALADKRPVIDALEVAVAAGAWSVQRHGATDSIPTAEDLASDPVADTG